MRMTWKRWILCSLLASARISPAYAQPAPLVDHHQHLFSPAVAKLLSQVPLPEVDLPSDLNALMQARARVARDATIVAGLYTDDAFLVRSGGPNWIRGREAISAWWTSNRTQIFRLTPVGWSATGSGGYVSAYVTQGDRDAPRQVAHVLISVRKDETARWRIAAEAVATPGPRGVPALTGSRLVALLDAAGIQRAAVFSLAYMWGSAAAPVEAEYAQVTSENDWTSQQVAAFPDRLRGFCSFNPLRNYALEELARCARVPGLRTGVKLHFANSDVDLHNPRHVAQLRAVFRAANDLRVPVVVHLRPTLSRPYGRDEARIFLSDVVSAAPDIPIQIAHLAGAGPGYSDPRADEALSVFAEAIAAGDPRAQRLLFDVATVVDLNISVEQAKLVASRIRQLGVERVLYGSDAASDGNLPPRQGWAVFRQLPLSEEEFRTIAANVAPYMR
jgi:predicted TIM-barrel fold metal-dependent hydrolase